MNDGSNENLSHRAWSDICDDPALLSRISLCLRPVPVHVSTNALYGMPMNIDITRDIDDRILITAYSMDNLRGTSFEVSYDEQFCRDSIADCEGIEPDEFESLDQLYQLMAEHCEIMRDQKTDKLFCAFQIHPQMAQRWRRSWLESERKRSGIRWMKMETSPRGRRTEWPCRMGLDLFSSRGKANFRSRESKIEEKAP